MTDFDSGWRERIAPIINRAVRGDRLTAGESEQVFFETSRADTDGYYYIAFSSALMARGVSEQELLGIVRGLQRFSRPIKSSMIPTNTTDVSGTGGGRFRTFNVSTASAMVVAAAGIPVAKQAYRAVSSILGSADILARVGVRLPGNPQTIESLLNSIGIAPVEYSAFFGGMEVRLRALQRLRELGLRLQSPSHLVAFVPSPVQLSTRTYGMFTDRHLETVARIFIELGYRRGMIFYGDGIPEITTAGETLVVEFDSGSLKKYVLRPQELGVSAARREELQVVDETDSIRTFLRVLAGTGKEAARNLVAVNAGASIYVNNDNRKLVESIDEAIAVIASGRALEKLQQLVYATAGDSGLGILTGLLSKL